MSATVQDVIDRASSYSPLNASLATDPIELLTRIQQIQQRIFSAVASLPATIVGRSRFTTSASAVSTNASSGRTFDLSTLSVPMERLLRVTLPSGTEVLPVTEFDVNVQLVPRYFIRGQSLHEVSSDWGATGTITLSLVYASGATAISPTGATSQSISVPDEWIDLVVKPLAMYFHVKDPGRDPAEYQALDQEYTRTWNGFLAYVTNYAGELNQASLAAMLPSPPEARR